MVNGVVTGSLEVKKKKSVINTLTVDVKHAFSFSFLMKTETYFKPIKNTADQYTCKIYITFNYLKRGN